jgi:hypothetical protein
MIILGISQYRGKLLHFMLHPMLQHDLQHKPALLQPMLQHRLFLWSRGLRKTARRHFSEPALGCAA